MKLTLIPKVMRGLFEAGKHEIEIETDKDSWGSGENHQTRKRA